MTDTNTPSSPAGSKVSETEVSSTFNEMMQGLKKKADDTWAFWKAGIVVLGTESEIYKECEPKYFNKGVLIVKCNNAVVRYELYREQFMMMEKLNEHLPEGKKISKIVFR